ncbi:uncharacterized protein ColSpa_09599 [Colletotrichum spaethianum]|uniref:Uncharacterized protein n=1 Tax=Colletotrichum spaethianum TaxID=700344 RepID=A0AA37PBV6_9PEZI|nr:uncharacterized protein ColSpa_09599 [Colletotrichum spaethianum]GKT49418.1 hypothetical protein ColSpa_09599 [Colletotrichum spaethianum]
MVGTAPSHIFSPSATPQPHSISSARPGKRSRVIVDDGETDSGTIGVVHLRLNTSPNLDCPLRAAAAVVVVDRRARQF